MFALGDSIRRLFRSKQDREYIRVLKAQLQAFHNVDPLTGETDGTRNAYRGNTYIGDKEMIEALDLAYNGEAEWGVQVVSNILNMRAAMIGGAGIEPAIVEGYTKDPPTRELEFLWDFIRYNDLHSSNQIDWAVEGGIEGRAMAKLQSRDVNGKKKVKVTYIPWGTGRYSITTHPDDYTRLKGAEVNKKDGSKYTIPPDKFVYRSFGGRISQANISPPITGTVLPQCEALDKALRDWREINLLFASPTPVIVTDDPRDQATVHEFVTKQINWKIGELLVIGGGKYSLEGPPMEGIDSILKEIEHCVRIISSVTGIPIHHLGYSDLLSNRATADSMGDLMISSTAKERNAWVEWYTDMFRKAIVIHNKTSGETPMDPDAIKAQLPADSATRLQQIIDVWLPMFEAKAITRQTMLKSVPGVDPSTEDTNVKAALEAGDYDGVDPNAPTAANPNGLGEKKTGAKAHDPDNTRKKAALEKRTGGAGRNAR